MSPPPLHIPMQPHPPSFFPLPPSNLGHDVGVELKGVQLGLSELLSPCVARHAQEIDVADTRHLHRCVWGGARILTTPHPL